MRSVCTCMVRGALFHKIMSCQTRNRHVMPINDMGDGLLESENGGGRREGWGG